MSIDRTTFRSPNHEPRPDAVSALVLHTTEGAFPSDAQWLSNPASKVSTHYVIDRAGQVYQLVDDDRVAWHAGVSHYAGLASWNDFSIGVEVSHKRGQDWPVTQWDAARELCAILIERYQIRLDRRVAHRWIAPTRRSDPTDRTDDELFWFFSAFGHATAQPWRPYRVVVPVARVRSTPTTDAPVARKMARGAVLWGTEVLGARVSGDPHWIARRFGGYIHASLLGVARDLGPV